MDPQMLMKGGFGMMPNRGILNMEDDGEEEGEAIPSDMILAGGGGTSIPPTDDSPYKQMLAQGDVQPPQYLEDAMGATPAKQEIVPIELKNWL
jgi:hypothetical protein